MKVKCIDRAFTQYLRHGEIYEIKEKSKDSETYFIEIGGSIRAYDKNRFEIVEDKKVKRYKTWEATKILGENKNVRFKGKIDRCVATLSNQDGYIISNFENLDYDGIDGNIKFDDEWEIVQSPVTFEEVLNSDKRCRVEHELIDSNLRLKNGSICSCDSVTKNDFRDLNNKNYMGISSLMHILPWILGNKEFKQVIKEGKWYLEEE